MTTALEALLVGLAERSEPAAAAVRAAVPGLARFIQLLLEANAAVNLVSRRTATAGELVSRHLSEALDGVPLLPEPAPGRRFRLLDIGSGGGFPAVPLMLVRRDLDGVLVEATRKKCRFLEAACRELGLTGEVVNARFPAPSLMRSTARFDILTSRAVARAGLLVRQARPILSSRGSALLWTTEALYRDLLRDSGMHRGSFHRTAGTDQRGIAVLGGFT